MNAQKTRLARALELREPALAIIRIQGRWHDYGDGVRALTADQGEFSFSYSTPLQKIPGPSGEMIARAASHGIRSREAFPYVLDVWGPLISHPRGRCKVMSIEWDDKGRARLIGFKSGEWEAQLLHLAAKLAK